MRSRPANIRVINRRDSCFDRWNAWIGFNLSHSLGLVLFGALYGGIALGDFSFVAGSLFLWVSAVVVGLVYLLLALRFWFWLPATVSAVGTLCFVLGALSTWDTTQP
jgi:hypothetical protein